MSRISEHYLNKVHKNLFYAEFEDSAVVTKQGEIADQCVVRQYKYKPKVLGVTPMFFKKHSLNLQQESAALGILNRHGDFLKAGISR